MMGSYRLDDELGEGAVGLDMACFRVRIWAGAGWSLREDEGGTAVVKRGSSSSRRSLSLGAGGFFFFVGFLLVFALNLDPEAFAETHFITIPAER